MLLASTPRRRLIVNADDFGRSASINTAVIDAHQHGILMTASLMVNGDAWNQAVQLAKQHPKLGVGLHLTLCCGGSALTSAKIPNLVNHLGQFSDSPVRAGLKYFFSRRARAQLAMEIAEQFAKFAATGLPLDHVNSHLHFHLHPSVFSILEEHLEKWKVRALRLTYDPPSVDWLLGEGRLFYRATHAFIFRALAQRARPALMKRRVAHTSYVFGLLENARVTEDYILKLLRVLPGGDSELYSHPSLDEFKHEYDALISPRVAEAIRAERIELIRYQDLWQNC